METPTKETHSRERERERERESIYSRSREVHLVVLSRMILGDDGVCASVASSHVSESRPACTAERADTVLRRTLLCEDGPLVEEDLLSPAESESESAENRRRAFDRRSTASAHGTPRSSLQSENAMRERERERVLKRRGTTRALQSKARQGIRDKRARASRQAFKRARVVTTLDRMSVCFLEECLCNTTKRGALVFATRRVRIPRLLAWSKENPRIQVSK